MIRFEKTRSFIVAAVLFLTFFSQAAVIKGAEVSARPNENNATIADAFLDEELVYGIGFWFFENVAIGKVTLVKGENGEYVATLSAYTTGVVDSVLHHRKDTYISHLALGEDGRRFVTRRFEKTIETTGKVRRTVTDFDYEKRVMTWKGWENGKEVRSGEEDVPPGVYPDDPLAGFYNFRFGVYGPVEEGRVYKIPTFPKKGHVPAIFLRILTREDKEKKINNNSNNRPVDYFADVIIDKELFGSRSGNVEILFTRDMIPMEAVAKDLLFFGDVRGKLNQVGYSMSFKRKALEDR